jgi:hypothetical protein
MREIAGAILILAGSLLGAAGFLADAITRDQGGYGSSAYLLGSAVGFLGLVFLVSGVLKQAWDAIPVDNKRTASPKVGTPEPR